MIFGLQSALLGTAGAHAQMTRVRGRVTDSNGEPLAFVSVVFPGTTVGITTDEQGIYSLETRDTVTRNRARNDPDRHDTYHCRTYTKIELDLTNIRPGFRNRRMQRNFGFIFNYMDTSALTGQAYLPAMISESTADLYRSRSPEFKREVIRASRVSGVDNNIAVAQFTGGMHGDVNFYDNYIVLFNARFASPLSASGRSIGFATGERRTETKNSRSACFPARLFVSLPSENELQS